MRHHTYCLLLCLVGSGWGQQQGERQLRLEDIERDSLSGARKAQYSSSGGSGGVQGAQYSSQAAGQQGQYGGQGAAGQQAQYSGQGAGGQQAQYGGQGAAAAQQQLQYGQAAAQFAGHGQGPLGLLASPQGHNFYLPGPQVQHGLQLMLVPQIDPSLAGLLYQPHQPFVLPQQSLLLPQQYQLPHQQYLPHQQFVLPQQQQQQVYVPRYTQQQVVTQQQGVAGQSAKGPFKASPQLVGGRPVSHQQQQPQQPIGGYQSAPAYNPYNAIYQQQQQKFAAGVKSTPAPAPKDPQSQQITSYQNFKSIF